MKIQIPNIPNLDNPKYIPHPHTFYFKIPKAYTTPQILPRSKKRSDTSTARYQPKIQSEAQHHGNRGRLPSSRLIALGSRPEDENRSFTTIHTHTCLYSPEASCPYGAISICSRGEKSVLYAASLEMYYYGLGEKFEGRVLSAYISLRECIIFWQMGWKF